VTAGTHRRLHASLQGARLGQARNRRSPLRGRKTGNSINIHPLRIFSFAQSGNRDGRVRKTLAEVWAGKVSYSDEIYEPRPGPWEYSHIIIGTGLGRSRVPQNLGIGQKDCPDRNILGLHGWRQKYGKDER
jgi:hypothetical protein